MNHEQNLPSEDIQSRPQDGGSAQSTLALSLLALGVVYGDIGTSPLYAVKETFNPSHGIPFVTENILGGVSAIFWVLMIVVTLKYVTLVLRANNRGEGGIMALLALASSSIGERPRLRTVMLALGVFGASLFYGDAVLTPAISVLSAVEGLEVGTSIFKPWIVPISTGILIGLFLIQRHGTGLVGLLFGPVCALWFLALGASGIWNILQSPQILAALNPVHALHFVSAHGAASFIVLGSVLLAVTGAEALYAVWATSANALFAWPGSAWWRRRWCSITSDRARCCYPRLKQYPIRFICHFPGGRCIRWWRWPLRRP